MRLVRALSVMLLIAGALSAAAQTVTVSTDGPVKSLAAARDAARPLVVLAGHLDTVPPAGAPPAELRDGKILGRGSCDGGEMAPPFVHLPDDGEDGACRLDLRLAFRCTRGFGAAGAWRGAGGGPADRE